MSGCRSNGEAHDLSLPTNPDCLVALAVTPPSASPYCGRKALSKLRPERLLADKLVLGHIHTDTPTTPALPLLRHDFPADLCSDTRNAAVHDACDLSHTVTPGNQLSMTHAT